MPTTPGGTPYTVATISDPTAGTIRYGYPSSLPADMVTVLYAHGSGGAYNQFETLSAWTGLRNALIDAGAGWIESTGGGTRSWGNPDAQAAYEAAYTRVAAVLDLGDVVILGRSMGGLVAAWLYTQSSVVPAVGLIVNSGVQDVVAYYDGTSPESQASILTAWGAADRAALVTASATDNPVNYPASDWAGLNVMQLVGTADTTVPRADHGDAMRTVYAGQPAIDLLDVRTGGDHSQTNGCYLEVDDMLAFIGSVADFTAPAPVAREYLNTIAHYVVIGGEKFTITPL